MADETNWFLIVSSLIIFGIAGVISFYFLVNFQHPDDKNAAYVPKVAIVAGLTLAIIEVCMFPLDIANSSSCGALMDPSKCYYTFNMELFWQIIFILNPCMVCFLIFVYFYYEQDDEDLVSLRVKNALKWSIVAIVMLLVISLILYGTLGTAEYETEQLVSGITAFDSTQNLKTCIPVDGIEGTRGSGCLGGAYGNETIEFKQVVTYPIYIVTVYLVLSSLLFVWFGGQGLFSLPLTVIQALINRPLNSITRTEFESRARQLVPQAKNALAVIDEFKRIQRESGKLTRSQKKDLAQLQQSVLAVQADHHNLKVLFPQGQEGVIMFHTHVFMLWVRGIFGGVAAIFALAWLLHVCFYVLPSRPAFPFLNTFFEALDGVGFLPNFFGVIFFLMFTGYLMLAVLHGISYPTFFSSFAMFPMQMGKTSVPAMLVNTAIVLLSGPAIVQFSADSFAGYAANTYIQQLFGARLRSLTGIKWLYEYNLFIILFLVVAVLTLIMKISTLGREQLQIAKAGKKKITMKSVEMMPRNPKA